jgi:hypothetical protein
VDFEPLLPYPYPIVEDYFEKAFLRYLGPTGDNKVVAIEVALIADA